LKAAALYRRATEIAPAGSQRQEVEAQYIAMFKRLRQYLRDGVANGSLRALEPTATTRALLGSIDWAFSWLNKIPPAQLGSTALKAVDILTRGLYGGKGEYAPSALDMAGPGTRPPEGFNREQQNRLKQDAFYKTGTWLFNKKGFDGTSLDEIAEQLHVSKGAFYYHIRSKEDLLFNCYGRSIDLVENIHMQVPEPGFGLKVEQTCRRIFYCQNTDEAAIRYNSIIALPTARRRDTKRTDAANECWQLSREGIEDGSVCLIDPFIAQNLIAGGQCLHGVALVAQAR
jgi:hypothetical protein